MADTTTNITNLDIQLLDADRSGTVTIKLDNPKANVTREQVSAAMQPALSAGWFLSSKGTPAMYLGDITINQSIKTKLGGEDFYVTPNTLNYGSSTNNIQIDVTGSTIQGYNILNRNTSINLTINVNVAENKLSANVSMSFSGNTPSSGTKLFDLILVIQGLEITVPAYFV